MFALGCVIFLLPILSKKIQPKTVDVALKLKEIRYFKKNEAPKLTSSEFERKK